MSGLTQTIVRVREGEPLSGAFVRLIATEEVPIGAGTNTVRVYTIVVLLDSAGEETG